MSKISNVNFMQSIPNSAFFSDLDMILNFCSLYRYWQTQDNFIDELILRLKNTKANGYTLVKQKSKRKVATKKKKS
jgi:hypothetical protein